MDENARFLIERMDAKHKEVMEKLELLHIKINALEGFRQRVLGMSMVISGGVALIAEGIKHKLGG